MSIPSNQLIPHLDLHLCSLHINIIILGRVSPGPEVVPFNELEGIVLEFLFLEGEAASIGQVGAGLQLVADLGLVEFVSFQVLGYVDIEVQKVSGAWDLVKLAKLVTFRFYLFKVNPKRTFFARVNKLIDFVFNSLP